jgi:hypothetical protein
MFSSTYSRLPLRHESFNEVIAVSTFRKAGAELNLSGGGLPVFSEDRGGLPSVLKRVDFHELKQLHTGIIVPLWSRMRRVALTGKPLWD